MVEDKIKIRDFIYLDVERMKSIFAQIYEGLNESSTEEVGGQQSLSTSIEGSGGIPLIAKIKGVIKGGVVWENKETETKTLHDHMYNLIEEVLKDQDSIHYIDGTDELLKSSWIDGELENKISDTSFLLIKGRVMIDDYQNFQKLFRNFNKIQEAIGSFQLEIPKDPIEKELFKQILRRTWKEQGTSLDEDMIENILLLLAHFYQNELFIKVLPYSDNYFLRFIGNLNKEFLRDSMESIIFKYGTFPVSEWYVFGQVSSIFPNGYNPSNFQDPKYGNIIQNAGNINTILTNIKNSGIIIRNNHDLDQLDVSSIANVSQENIEFLKSFHLGKEDYNVLQNVGLDIVFESIFNSSRGLDYVFSTKFPSVTFTPIAIYRGD